ncbi:hypothetical protein E2562_016089 [Oryza meyeriana var. granulata]|uniref:Uncharacterized protein n=1 Tax=Oryza meyeriana var. granulata TaxID=110450 RepID=A0A6G1BMJ6_9ORYZ|nr:hypothetical protein E2562_016089 [Oryza meyeriana var. granulata]
MFQAKIFQVWEQLLTVSRCGYQLLQDVGTRYGQFCQIIGEWLQFHYHISAGLGLMLSDEA